MSQLRLLAEPGFFRFVVSRLFSGAGLLLLRATVSWQVYEISQSAFFLGLVGLLQFAATFTLGLFGGAAADVYDRKRLVIGGQILPAICSATLAFRNATGAVDLLELFVLVILVSMASAFENPARAAMLPQMVTREQFPAAVSIHTAVQMFAFMSGPVIMGFVLDWKGIVAPYLLHFMMVAVSIALFATLQPRPLDTDQPRAVRWSAIREGLAFVWRQPVVLGCMTLDMFAVLFGGAVALLPIYATDILQVGPRGYGLLSSALEIGAVFMAVILISRPAPRRAGSALLIAVAVFAVATIVFGLSRSFPLSLVAYMFAGMADYVSMVIRGTVIQLSTPDALRGRVSSVNSLFIGASNQLGAAESGFVAALTNPTFSVVSGGVAALLVTAIVAWRNAPLRAYVIR